MIRVALPEKRGPPRLYALEIKRPIRLPHAELTWRMLSLPQDTPSAGFMLGRSRRIKLLNAELAWRTLSAPERHAIGRLHALKFEAPRPLLC